MANNFQFITCPECKGRGSLKEKRCSHCRGLGVFAYFKGRFLFYDKEFNFRKNNKQKARKFFNKIINFLLLIFGLAGVLVLISAIFHFGENELYLEDLLSQKNPLILFFWFSLLADMYLAYRLERGSESRKKIKSFPADSSPYSKALDFFQALKVKNKFKIKVSAAFSEKAEELIWRSWNLANKLKHSRVEPVHIFALLLLHPQIKEILARLEVDQHLLKSKVRYQLSLINNKTYLEPKISIDLKKVILKAYAFAYEQKKASLGIFELLNAAIEQDSLVKEILFDLEIDLEKVKNVIAWISFNEELAKQQKGFKVKALFKPKGAMNRAFTAVATPFLDQHSQDLTALAKAGYFSLCVGREEETKQIFKFLQAGENGFVLVGDPGVGKSSLIEGLAQLMVEEEVPQSLRDKRLISLNVSSLVGGEDMSIESRLKIIINEVVRAGNIILFIENISNIVGLKSRGGELDVADILASYLDKKYLILFSTCSLDDWQRVLKNSPLSNVLEKIEIEEPTGSKAIQILESKASVLEVEHLVYFSYKTIEQIVELSSRYLPDKFLPEKGIMLLREVAVYARESKGKDCLITGEDVAYLLSQKTKIPLTKITEKESEKLLNLEKRIHQRIIGQSEAVIAVSTALRRARTELREMKRPIANLLFLGPTGVGKTELAKAISEIYFGSEENMIRLDMSEYQEKPSIDRLLGSMPGYAGSELGGYLTEAVKKQPFSLLLLDEIEKAHPDILNLFLQVMEDGRLTDNSGRTIDFTNVILIGTSNASSNFIQEQVKKGEDVKEIKKQLLNQQLKPYFLPEFLNRFDEIIVFRPLAKEEIKQIAHLLLTGVQRQLDKKGITLRATDEAIEELVELGYDPVFGARPLRRVIQERVNNALANHLLKGELKRRDVAVLEKEGKVRIVKAKEL